MNIKKWLPVKYMYLPVLLKLFSEGTLIKMWHLLVKGHMNPVLMIVSPLPIPTG